MLRSTLSFATCMVVAGSLAATSFAIPTDPAAGIVAHPLRDLTDSPDPTTPKPVAAAVFGAILKIMHIDNVDVNACVKDEMGASRYLRDFGTDLVIGDYSNAMSALGMGISALSSSVEACGVPAIQNKLDALAAAIKFAKITDVDKVFKVLIGASSLEKDVEVLGAAVKKGDNAAIGGAINTLLNDFTTLSGGCGDSGICHLLDGLLRSVMQFENNIQACESTYAPAYLNLTAAVKTFRANNTQLAIQELAAGLEDLGGALSGSACGMQLIGGLISKMAPKLTNAVVKDESIVVGYANLYDEFYQAVLDVENGDIVGFGVQIGRMLQSLKASNCKSKACVALQGLLGVVQLETEDFGACSTVLDTAWTDFAYFMNNVEEGNVGNAIRYFAQGVSYLGSAVSKCGIPGVAKMLEDTATKLGDAAIATEVGAVVSVLVEGADVTDQLTKLSSDFAANRWPSVGNDLDQLSTYLTSVKCNSFVCNVVEGLLNAVGTGFRDLQACEADLHNAEDNFVLGAQQFRQRQLSKAVKSWGAGLNIVAQAVSECGLDDELKFMQQEAQVLGFGNATAIGNFEKILVHGADVYNELYSALTSLEQHDWRNAGQQMGTVLNQLSQWTSGHACTSDVCYVVVGVLQFMGDIQGSVKECEGDISASWTDFRYAVSNFSDSHHSIFHWHTNKEAIKAGVKNLGGAFTSIAKAVGDCHLQEFADLLAKLALKLGIVPEVSFLEELLHILIEGVHIEQEVGAACTAFGDGNWVQFGFNLAKLIKTLL